MAAGVDVERVSQKTSWPSQTLECANRPAGPIGVFPEVLAGLRGFPQANPARFLFVAIVIDTCAGLNSSQINLRELRIRKFAIR